MISLQGHAQDLWSRDGMPFLLADMGKSHENEKKNVFFCYRGSNLVLPCQLYNKQQQKRFTKIHTYFYYMFLVLR